MKIVSNHSYKCAEFAILILIISALFIATTKISYAKPLSQTEDGEVYIVQEGDWISKLAEKFYDDPLTWPTIWKATNDKFEADSDFALVTDPHKIEIGQTLWIPTADKLEQFLIANQSENKISGVFIRQFDDGSYSVLRFYEDGVVLAASIQTEDIVQDWSRINQWFHRDSASPSYSTGQYYSISDHISFSSTSQTGTVDRAGSYLENKLILDSYSHINGRKFENNVYEYLDVES